MFINFWYPADQSQKIGEEPVKLRILGQDVVLWRDSHGKKLAYAIPSPARRHAKNWVLDSVPLIPGEAAAAKATGT